MRRIGVYCAAALASAACAGGFGAPSGLRTIASTPPGALVTVEGFGECETPCTIKVDQERNVTVARAGYEAQRFVVGPTGGDIDVQLELAAPAGAVEDGELPSLD